MAKNSDQTASFLVRFTQKIYKDEQGESNVQWRGKISHVQGGDQKSFVDFEKALQFIQEKLSELTISSIDDKPKEEREGLLVKSFDIWKKMAKTYPKMVIEAIKDPKAQVSQIQEQITQVGEEIGQKIEIDSWRAASKNDYKSMMAAMTAMASQIEQLNEKLDKLSK